MAPINSNRSVRIVDAVSVYEPDSPKPTTYSMDDGNNSTVKGNNNNHFVRSRNHTTGTTGRVKKTSHHLHGSEHRQSFFLNKLFRSGSAKTPYNSFRHTDSTSHDDRSNNDESTNPGSSIGIQFMTSVTNGEDAATMETEVTNKNNYYNNNNPITPDKTQLKSTMMPPSPLLKNAFKATKQHQQPPERRKFFMDKLFTVSRMHVSEAGRTSLSNPTSSTNESNNNVRRSYKINCKQPIIKSHIAYSLDGDTTTTNSSVGVDEDVDDFSYKKSTTKSPNRLTSQQRPTFTSTMTKHNTDSPTTTILMELPTADQEIMEIQTDHVGNTPTTMETEMTTPPSTKMTIIPSTNHYHSNDSNYSNSSKLFEHFKLSVPPESNRSPAIQYVSPQVEQELPATSVLEQKPILKSKHDTYSSHWTNFWGATSSSNNITDQNNQYSNQREEWPKRYYGAILDKVTNIHCITNCSDMDLARCDDAIEDYVASPVNTSTNYWSGNDGKHRVATTHRLSANSILKQGDQSFASNSMNSDGEYEDDDLRTYDDSMISASLFDIDTLDDEYTYTTFENDDDPEVHRNKNIDSSSNNNTKLPIHIQKSLLSDPSCNTSKYLGDDDGTSYSSQNSAWL